ncbi:DsrE family protein [Thiomicrorhabdus heinhorstiae]|uniref:DsrE family protein n=1 Tax=Thiomicrorhabdus heinhorstiae TaxID=2748010 RepID=A0ABS0BYB5_9GAMM|nr:DsrE family protein [Thiomicrorhabdus heinhorstiae]MBF6058055.1 DsrE family protein [Thiomicrorhabdus heinhorstiae]
MNLFKKLIHTALIALAFIGFSTQVQAADDGAKVVYHVDFKDPTRYSATLTSINNILNYYESELMEADVHLVFVGYGLRFTTDDDLKGTPYEADQALKERREELKGRLNALMNVRGVKVHLCDKTRDEVGLPQSKVYKGIDFAPSGVAKIAILQSEGYSYLKIQ